MALLLRHLRDEDDGAQPSRSQSDHRFAGASDATRVLSLILIPLLVSLGVYLALHGALTPGGGFQAGVVLAAGPLVILLAGRYLALKRVAPRWALDVLDAASATAYALIGLGGLIFASVYLENFLPLGTSHLLSARMMPLNSIAVGLEVTGAFLLTWTSSGPGPAGGARRAVMGFAPFAAAAWLFVIGLYGVVSSQNLVRTVLSLTVVQSSTYLVLLGVGYRHRAGADRGRHPDDVAAGRPGHSGAGAHRCRHRGHGLALLLALVVQAHKRFGSVDPARLRALRD